MAKPKSGEKHVVPFELLAGSWQGMLVKVNVRDGHGDENIVNAYITGEVIDGGLEMIFK